MKILISDNVAEAFIIDAGNRYTFLFTKHGEQWHVKGGHLWQTGQPRIPSVRHDLYFNPNTGEKKGIWVTVYECFMTGTHNDYTPQFAEDVWQAWLKSKDANIQGDMITAEDKEKWLKVLIDGINITLNTIGLCQLYHKYECLSYDYNPNVAWEKAAIQE